jgi:hypothetical protein
MKIPFTTYFLHVYRVPPGRFPGVRWRSDELYFNFLQFQFIITKLPF